MAKKRLDRRTIVWAASVAAHAILLTALAAGLRAPERDPEPPTMSVTLISPPRSPPPEPVRPRDRPQTAARPAPTPTRAVAAERAAEAGLPLATGPRIEGPPAARPAAANLTGLLRGRLGCGAAALHDLTDAEREACDARLAKGVEDAPVYAVISKARKAEFDGDCKPDDEWCLYRVGKGPYPGLRSLFKKK